VRDLALAAASRRLRADPPPGFPGRAGRPRKHPIPAPGGASPAAPERPAAGTPRVQSTARTRVNSGRNEGTVVYQVPAPRRLLDLAATATYLGLAPWTVRELEWRGVLRRVRVPLPNGGEVRKLLFDVRDLDALIDRWKDAPTTSAEAARKADA
jgi:hypothetical protein